MKKSIVAALSLTVLALTAGIASAAEAANSWTGEVVDMACYLSHGAKGAAHADCAKKCLKNGEPMGLLTSDGDLYLFAADHKDGAPFEALKEMAGGQAKVTGEMAEKSGTKMITVTAAAAVK